MIRITQLKIHIDTSDSSSDDDLLRHRAAKVLHIADDEILELSVLRRSIDARRKPDLYWNYTVAVRCAREEHILKHLKRENRVSEYQMPPYQMPPAMKDPGEGHRPVVVGAGPAGMFCALILASCGLMPVVIERGKTVDQRTADVREFWETGILDPFSNVQFGEGGAGTFSDGKLNTLVKDHFGRNRYVLNTFVECGAPSEILWDAKPHIGTDVLVLVMQRMREKIISLGGTFRFETRMTAIRQKSGAVTGIETEHAGQTDDIETDTLILAIGHSARDTFEELCREKIQMQAKPFAVGFRVEHPQEMIDISQYGIHTEALSPSPYKLAHTFEDGRGIYSFCMCPGGYVVNASSEPGRLAVNGMSYADRGSANANSAIVVSVGEKEFDLEDPLSGMQFQRKLEEKAYQLAGGAIPQQLYDDFRNNCSSRGYGEFMSCTRGASELTNLRGLMTPAMEDVFLAGMKFFGSMIHGFDRPDAILSGMESRTSSPVRIPRDDSFQGSLSGLYPCGEGAGYAGGITSAAMDGMKAAEAVIRNMK